MTPLVLGIDLGTSYFKAGLFARDGHLHGLGRVPFSPGTDADGRCELPASAFWEKLKTAVGQALAQANATPAQIVAVSYAAQANSFLLLDGCGEPLTPIVLWPDLRAMPDGMSPLGDLCSLQCFPERSGVGVGLAPIFAAAKLRWFQRYQPDLWQRVHHVATVSDYFTLGLSGQHAGDAGSASLLGLLDARSGDWWPEALRACGLADHQMARLLAPGTVIGPARGPGAAHLGVQASIPFAVGTMDHHLAALGAGVGFLAEASASIGTVLACAAPTVSYTPAAARCLAPGIGGGYFALSFTDHGAAALEWYQRTFAPKRTIEQLLRSAELVPDDCGGLHADPSPGAPGTVIFTGQRPGHSHGHHVRAILESVAEALVSCLAKLPVDRPLRRVLAAGGGARSRFWLSLFACRSGLAVVRSDCPEPACRGAAMLAAVAAGWFAGPYDAAAAWAHSDAIIDSKDALKGGSP